MKVKPAYKAQQMSETTNQNHELNTKKTVLAQAMEGLDYSSSVHSQGSQQSQGSEPAHNEPEQGVQITENYSELDSYLNQSEPTHDDNQDVIEAEEMSEADAQAFSAFGVGKAAEFVESMFDHPVTIDNDTREKIAIAATPVVLKHTKGAQLPPWVAKYIMPYKEELMLIAALGSAGLSIYSQIKKAEKATPKSEPEYDKSGEVTVSAS